LEQKRRCGWLNFDHHDSAKPVWARRQVSLTTCPKSYITGESMALLEDFLVRQRFGRPNLEHMTAREADTFLILEEAAATEIKDARHDSR
jgi:hypothetical protein